LYKQKNRGSRKGVFRSKNGDKSKNEETQFENTSTGAAEVQQIKKVTRAQIRITRKRQGWVILKRERQMPLAAHSISESG